MTNQDTAGNMPADNKSIYGSCRDDLPLVLKDIMARIEAYQKKVMEEEGISICEHISARIKNEESMREKCRRKGLPESAQSALMEIRDAIGIRIVCGFVDDIYRNIAMIRRLPDVEVVEEKDYITHAKDNGYRSYHMIIRVQEPWADPTGQLPGCWYAEIQLRTIAMDTWASLEHQMSYKRNLQNGDMIRGELKRCADELASCDVSMQTIRELIRSSEAGE